MDSDVDQHLISSRGSPGPEILRLATQVSHSHLHFVICSQLQTRVGLVARLCCPHTPGPRVCDHSSSSSPPSSPPSSFFSEAFAFFLRTRPGLPPPNGLVSAKSMCFCESRRTMKDGTLTICLPTLCHTTECRLSATLFSHTCSIHGLQ